VNFKLRRSGGGSGGEKPEPKLQAALREGDEVPNAAMRMNGNEFVVVLSNASSGE
jgi:hypothetical protein